MILRYISIGVIWIAIFKQSSSTFTLNVDELKSIFYNLNILPVPVLKDEVTKDQHETVRVFNKFGQEYICTLPELDIFLNKSKAEEDLLDPLVDISELLRPMENAPCLVKRMSWWTYEFCYGSVIKQYHMEDNKVTGPILILGKYDSEYDWKNNSQSKNKIQKFHTQKYKNGTRCDITGDPREAEVRFHCEEGVGDSIQQVEEPESCRYVITIATTRVCHHPYLKSSKNKVPHSIRCSPALSADQMEAFQQKKIEEKKVKTEKEMKNKKKLKDITKLFGKEAEMFNIGGNSKSDVNVKMFTFPIGPKASKKNIFSEEIKAKLRNVVKLVNELDDETIDFETDVPNFEKPSNEMKKSQSEHVSSSQFSQKSPSFTASEETAKADGKTMPSKDSSDKSTGLGSSQYASQDKSGDSTGVGKSAQSKNIGQSTGLGSSQSDKSTGLGSPSLAKSSDQSGLGSSHSASPENPAKSTGLGSSQPVIQENPAKSTGLGSSQPVIQENPAKSTGLGSSQPVIQENPAKSTGLGSSHPVIQEDFDKPTEQARSDESDFDRSGGSKGLDVGEVMKEFEKFNSKDKQERRDKLFIFRNKMMMIAEDFFEDKFDGFLAPIWDKISKYFSNILKEFAKSQFSFKNGVLVYDFVNNVLSGNELESENEDKALYEIWSVLKPVMHDLLSYLREETIRYEQVYDILNELFEMFLLMEKHTVLKDLKNGDFWELKLIVDGLSNSAGESEDDFLDIFKEGSSPNPFYRYEDVFGIKRKRKKGNEGEDGDFFSADELNMLLGGKDFLSKAQRTIEKKLQQNLKLKGSNLGQKIEVKILSGKLSEDKDSSKSLSEEELDLFNDLIVTFLFSNLEEMKQKEKQEMLEHNYHFQVDEEEQAGLNKAGDEGAGIGMPSRNTGENSRHQDLESEIPGSDENESSDVDPGEGNFVDVNDADFILGEL